MFRITALNPIQSRSWTGKSRSRFLKSRTMTTGEFFNRVWAMLVGRAGGPLTLRLLVQPTVAAILAVRAGLRDAREGRTPYLWAAFTNPAHRRDLLRQGWKDMGKVFIVAVVLDVIYELIVHRWLYPGQALIVATVLAIIPYALIRGLVTRIARRFIKTTGNSHDKPD